MKRVPRQVTLDPAVDSWIAANIGNFSEWVELRVREEMRGRSV